MTYWLKFSGWFQCRLATDPDPTDEPRGISGYARALPNEPDFDRIIRLQPANVVHRRHCPAIGVYVNKIWENGKLIENHPIIGSAVDFIDNPKFEGRNTILAAVGEEPIFPLNLQIKNDRCLIQRSFNDGMTFPPVSEDDYNLFSQLKASGIHMHPGTIAESTGIFSLEETWQERIKKLKDDLEMTESELDRSVISSRIKFLSNTGYTQIFSARMLYSVTLSGNAIFDDPENIFSRKPAINDRTRQPIDWPLEFWCGAWDAEALSGYLEGYVTISTKSIGESLMFNKINEMINDPFKRRL